MAVSSVTALCLSTRNGVTTRGQQHCNGTYLNGINGSCKQLSVGIAIETGVSLNKLSPRKSPAIKLIDITSSSFYAIDDICTAAAADGDLPQLTPHKDASIVAEGSHSGKREREDDERNDARASAMQENISPPHLVQMAFREEMSSESREDLCFGKRKRRRASVALPQGSQSSESSSATSVCGGQLKASPSAVTLAESSTCDGVDGSGSQSDVESSSQSAVGGAGAANDQEDGDNHTVPCSWDGCGVKLMSPALADHLRQCHVDAQIDGEFVSCLWHGCKVYRQRSRSRIWLETHVLRHAGNKPFLCIVDGCGQRFASRRLLERHVNAHLNRMSQQQQACPKLQKNRDEARLKLLKRKKLQVARPWAAKVADYFDSCTMEHLCSQIVRMHAVSGIDMEKSLKRVTFRSEVIGKRCTESGNAEVLLKWHPENVLADEWVSESQRQKRRQHVCALSEVPAHAVSSVHPALYRQHRFRKQRRK